MTLTAAPDELAELACRSRGWDRNLVDAALSVARGNKATWKYTVATVIDAIFDEQATPFSIRDAFASPYGRDRGAPADPGLVRKVVARAAASCEAASAELRAAERGIADGGPAPEPGQAGPSGQTGETP
jgi:hypothetical protein